MYSKSLVQLVICAKFRQLMLHVCEAFVSSAISYLLLYLIYLSQKKSYTIKKNPQEFLVLYKHHCRPILMFKIKSTNYYREGLRIGYIP